LVLKTVARTSANPPAIHHRQHPPTIQIEFPTMLEASPEADAFTAMTLDAL
jgi:hypothetical protein